MNLTRCFRRRASLEYVHHFEFRQYSNIGGNDGDDTSDEGSLSHKPLEKSFVYQMFKEFGGKSQDKQARESMKADYIQEQEASSPFHKSSQYFRDHDRPQHRLYGMYYKMANSEIASFHSRGFLSINHLLHPYIPEELPFIHDTLSDIITQQLPFDTVQMQNTEVLLNLDIGTKRDEHASSSKGFGGQETKIDEQMSIVLPPVYKPRLYKQKMTMIKNVHSSVKNLRKNYFELRGLSIARQLFIELFKNGTVNNDFQLLSDDMLFIDPHKFMSPMEDELIKFNSPVLTSIVDMKQEDMENEDIGNVYLVCVLATENAILTLKRKDFNEYDIPPNVPLTGGSVFVVDPRKFDQILYWRRNDDPTTFMINTYGEKDVANNKL